MKNLIFDFRVLFLRDVGPPGRDFRKGQKTNDESCDGAIVACIRTRDARFHTLVHLAEPWAAN